MDYPLYKHNCTNCIHLDTVISQDRGYCGQSVIRVPRFNVQEVIKSSVCLDEFADLCHAFRQHHSSITY